MADAPPFTATSDYTRDPTFSLSPPPAPGTAALSIVLGAEAWQGDPEAVILLDGREVFHGLIHASRASGGIVIELGEVSLADAHNVTVRFLNDAWGGTANMDRNLHVEDVRLDQVSTGQHAALLTTGEVILHLPGSSAQPTPVVPPAPAPEPVAPGVLIRLGLSEDRWQGDAHATVLLDGVVLAAGLAVTASREAGQVQYLDLRADLSAGPHKLSVRFLDDAWGGNAAADRNLYVESLAVGGKDLNQSAALLWSRDADFLFVHGPQAAQGQDVIQLKVSADSWAGDPHFLILVDGKQMGGTRSTAASHAAGQSETIDIRGDFSSGPHELLVRFLDDAWGGTAAMDRNLYVDSVAWNGTDLRLAAALLAEGDAIFAF